MQTASFGENLSDRSAEARQTMVDRQIRTFDVTDAVLLTRIENVPREAFLPPDLKPFAYSDSSLQLKTGDPAALPRTLLPPLILARLIQGAALRPADKVLVVAAASGYSTAIIAGLADAVVALESDPKLFERARAALTQMGLDRVRLVQGPLAAGVVAEAPFDAIVIDGGVAGNLDPLLAQLRDGGRLVAVQRIADGTGKAVRYDKADGATGYRILFDAPAPVLDAFTPEPLFTFS